MNEYRKLGIKNIIYILSVVPLYFNIFMQLHSTGFSTNIPYVTAIQYGTLTPPHTEKKKPFPSSDLNLKNSYFIEGQY